MADPESDAQEQSSKSDIPFVASDFKNDGMKHVLLAATGSVATIKIPKIIMGLDSFFGLSIRIILTKAAANFLAGQSPEQPSLTDLAMLPNVDGIYLDEDEWEKPWTRGDAILHIELRRWADLMVIAPLSANSLAKMTTGQSDNLLLSVVRAWDASVSVDNDGVDRRKIIIVAIAMNTAMWRHPITKKQIRVLEDDWGISGGGTGWIEVLKPIEKSLACGDVGDGAMREWTDICWAIARRLGLKTSGT